MDREPKISEIEKLIKHFRETNREHELLEVLKHHNISKNEPVEVIEEGTHEFHEEGLVLNNIAKKEGFIKKTNLFFVRIINAFKAKWYLRYGVYYIAIFIAIFALLNAPIILSWFNPPKQASNTITVTEVQGGKMGESAPLAPGEVVPATSQVVIPKISVKAPIIYLNTRDEKTVQANLTNGVVHYAGTAKPGEVGNAFITGHSSNYWWIKGNYNYVFVHLNKLAIGDQAVIYNNGKKFVYSVTETKVVAPEDTSVLAQTDTPTLTLMTCTPPGTNWKRLIVKLNQIAPAYEKPKVVTKEIKVENQDKNGILPGDSNSVGAIFLNIIDFFERLF